MITITSIDIDLSEIGRRIDNAYEQTQIGRNEWIDGSIDLAVALAEARDCFDSDNAFSAWIGENGHDHLGKNDRAALINFGRDPNFARTEFVNTTSSSYQHIWVAVKDRYPQVRKPTVEPTSVSESPAQPAVAPKTAEPESAKQPAAPPVIYDVPKESKLHERIGESAASVLLSRFKHSRMFNFFHGGGSHRKRERLLRYLADRCVKPDYPPDFFLRKTWTVDLLYPHLPPKLLDATTRTEKLNHTNHLALVQTEELFVKTPEFGVTDPPMVAFNKAHSLYQAVKLGGASAGSFAHKPTLADDEGKPSVVVRGTQLWPAEIGAGYCYDDLRCAYNLAHDIVITFGEPKDAPMATKSLKLRHVMSWLPGGYNSVGSSMVGTLKALTAVVQAYGTNKSDVMRAPPPSLKKLGE